MAQGNSIGIRTLPPIPLYGKGYILVQCTPCSPFSIQAKNSWWYQGLSILLWLACTQPAWSSRLSAPSYTVHDRSCRPPEAAVACFKNQARSAALDPYFQDRLHPKRSRKQVRPSSSLETMGTMTLGSVSLTKAFDAAPHSWFPPLTFALVLAVGASCSLQQKSHRIRRRQSAQRARIPAPMTDSSRRLVRRPIHAAVEVHWNKQLYRGRATEMGTQSIRVEVDERTQGIKRLMPVGLVFKQEDARPSQRLLAQVISITFEGNHRSVLELRFPDRWQQQQNRKVQYLLNTLH
jgi:hypothetical protein